MRPRLREFRVRPIEGFTDRHSIEHDQVTYGVRVVQRGAQSDVRATVVSDYCELVDAQHVHQSDNIGRHRTFRRLRVVRLIRQLR